VKRTRLSLTQLEDKLVPATLGLSGGVLTYDASPGIANNITISVSGDTYTITDSGEKISVLSGFTSSRGTGTNTVTGKIAAGTPVRFNLGDSDDTINVRGLKHSLAIHTGTGSDRVNVSSNAPTNSGSVGGILGAIDVQSGESTRLTIGASTQTGTPGAVNVDADSIDGLLGNGSYSLSYSGTFSQIRILAPQSLTLAKTFTVDSPSASFRFDLGEGQNTVNLLGSTQQVDFYTGQGDNTFNILGDSKAYIETGGGDDVFYVAPGVTLDGDIYGRWGADVFDIQGTVTGYVGI